MRSHGHLWLFVFLVLIGFDGAGTDTGDTGSRPSGPGEADAPALVASPPALPPCQWTPAEGGGDDLDGIPGTLAAAAPVAAPFPAGLPAREAEWLSFRRPFADTVSYRTTAPPSRIA